MKPIAKNIITKFGDGCFTTGAKAVSEVLGVTLNRVYKMTYAKAKGGTDGLVPAVHQQPLLDAARKRGVPVEPADFFT